MILLILHVTLSGTKLQTKHLSINDWPARLTEKTVYDWQRAVARPNNNVLIDDWQQVPGQSVIPNTNTMP